VTYTDFDFSGFSGCQCPVSRRHPLRDRARLLDQWRKYVGAPVIVHEECYFAGGFNGVQGSNPVVAPDGTVYVGYDSIPRGAEQ